MIDLDFQGTVARIVLAAPPANTINPEWCSFFHRAIDEIEQNPGVRVVHIKSSLRLFCAGADLKYVEAGFANGEEGMRRFSDDLRRYQELFLRVENLPCTTLAEIGGAALGGGLELALACDLRAVANEAKVGLPEAGLGLLPAIGGTQRLTTLCGEATAKRLIFLGEVFTGAEAVRLGVAQWAFPASDLPREVAELALRLSRMPGLAARFAKDCIHAARGELADGFDLEISRSRELFQSAETRAMVQEFLNRKNK